MKRKVMTVFGTRPEAIKMAPIVKALENDPELESLCVVTAQHRQMLDQVLDLFEIKPAYDLDIMKERQTLSGVLTRALLGLEEIMVKEKPDLVLVHGDTSTTFAGAIASYYQQIPVGHVEAGLRTWDKYQPYPEEMNRRLTGALTDLHFAPSKGSMDNLLKENIPADHIFVTGNTVIDALLMVTKKEFQFDNPEINAVLESGHRLILLTAHRRENWGEPLENICKAVLDIVNANPDVEVIYPVHLNPVVRDIVFKYLKGHERVHLIEPLDYLPFSHLMKRAHILLTDSGGVQEEGPALVKPVLVLREKTERPEALDAGTVKLVGTDKDVIIRETSELLNDSNAYNKMAAARNPYGDGHAAEMILQEIKNYFANRATTE